MKSQLKPAVNSNDHVQGSNSASIELVEYGDYQCPYCGLAYPILKNIRKKMGADLKFIFRNFPLTEIHPNAFQAAIAAEAAALQQKFWQMHDLIYENQNALETKDLVVYAKEIGLNLDRFNRDIQKQDLIDRVENDFESGIRSGVNGTPSFYVNGEKYNGDYEEEVFADYLKSLLSNDLHQQAGISNFIRSDASANQTIYSR